MILDKQLSDISVSSNRFVEENLALVRQNVLVCATQSKMDFRLIFFLG